MNKDDFFLFEIYLNICYDDAEFSSLPFDKSGLIFKSVMLSSICTYFDVLLKSLFDIL